MAWIKNEPIPPVRQAEIEPHAIFRKLYRPLGAVSITFADLEAHLTIALNLLLGTSWREGAALEWLMQNLNNRIELFYFLAIRATRVPRLGATPSARELAQAEAIRTLRASAEAIRKELTQVNSDRNNLLHGAWTGLSPDGLYAKDRLQATGGRLVEIPVRGISVQLLNEQADYFISISMRLADWTARFRRIDRPDLWPAPLHERYLRRSPLGRLLRDQKAATRRSQPPASRA